MVARVLEARLEVDRALGAVLGESVTEARASQHFREEQFLLGCVGDGANGSDHAQVILRNLSERRISR